VFRTLWFEGRPYPVSAHPFAPSPGEQHWYVQTRDGTWHAVAPRAREASLSDAWPELERIVRSWLSTHDVVDPDGVGPPFYVQVKLQPTAQRSHELHPLLGSIINTDRGQCYAEIGTPSRRRMPNAEEVAKHAANREPTQLTVSFQTTNQPAGVTLQFDTADFLEATVQAYLRRHPEELPVARPGKVNRG